MPAARLRITALVRDARQLPALRALGVHAVLGDLDDAASLTRLAGLAERVLYLAPPPATGIHDPRLRAALQALARRAAPRAVVLASTTGVYGHAHGQWCPETRAANPQTPRAQRRVSAEQTARRFGLGASSGQGVWRTSILRIPGIYAWDGRRPSPLARLERGDPVLHADEDVFVNHIHADDLAWACIRALFVGRPQRVVNVCDEGQAKMGDHFDALADAAGLPRPARVTREQAAQQLSPMQMSFMGESRRFDAQRMRKELKVALAHRTALDGLPAVHPAERS